jgi:type IV secretion system protein VirB2
LGVAVRRSLLEASGGMPMMESAHWIEGVMLGDIALGLCVISVAFIGALMLMGRVPLREGMRVVLGSFVLLGAPVIAAGLLEIGANSSQMPLSGLPTLGQAAPRPELPQTTYNPYAQASVRDDR